MFCKAIGVEVMHACMSFADFKICDVLAFLDRLDRRYTFPSIHYFAELGKVPVSYRYCIAHSMQSSKIVVRLRGGLKCTSEAIFTVMES